MVSHKLFKHLKKMWHVSIYRHAFGMWLVMEDLHQVAEDSFCLCSSAANCHCCPHTLVSGASSDMQ